jgi:hypothetical protein
MLACGYTINELLDTMGLLLLGVAVVGAMVGYCLTTLRRTR